MVIYARGGSEGMAMEAASRTGKRASMGGVGGGGESVFLLSFLRTRLLNLKLLNEYNIYMCAHSIVFSCAWNERN